MKRRPDFNMFINKTLLTLVYLMPMVMHDLLKTCHVNA